MSSYDTANIDPYDSQEYEAHALPYVPYATREEHISQSYNVATNTTSNAVYPPAPSAYENTPIYVQYAQDSVLPSQSEAPTATSLPSPSNRKKRRLWLPIGIITLIILVIAASTFALVSYLNRSTPTRTLDIFCTALQEGKYQMAYDQFTPSMQTNFTESQFADLLSSDSIATCSHGVANENGTSTTTDLHLYHSKSKGVNNDRVVVIKDSHNQWKINDIQRVS